MSNVEPRQALWAHLWADSTVRDVIGDRLYQRRVPEGAVNPLLVIWPPISRVPEWDLAGVTHWRTRLQVTAIADTQPDAEAAVRAVTNAVNGYKGDLPGLPGVEITVDNDRAMEEDELDEVFHHVDLIMTYKG